MDEIRVLSPTAILGYGFPVESFQRGMARQPHVIAVDAGSTDPGPYYLGVGKSFTDRAAVKRDLAIMLKAGLEANIPVIIGSAGGAGADSHLQWNLEIIQEIAAEADLHFSLATISAEISKEVLLEELHKGNIAQLPPNQAISAKDLADSTRVVAQMGIEPILSALNAGAQVVLVGRAYDPAVFAALPVKLGFDLGLALHMGKILECASIAATPGSGSDCMLGYLRQDHFVLEPLNPERKCTVTSVAAHTLYEKTNPYVLPGPGGVLDLHESKFEQVDENKVKVTGTKFVPDPSGYSVKLEGAGLVGFRTVSIAGVRDPYFIEQLDNVFQGVRDRVTDNFRDLTQEQYQLFFHVYGKNGVMGQLEPQQDITSQELGIIIEAVADTQDRANTICSFARSTMLHYGYPGRISTAGNLALLYSPSDLVAGAVYRFTVYHLLKVQDPVALFPLTLWEV